MSSIKGVNRLRRTLRRIEPAATQELRDTVEDGAQKIHFDALTLVPRDEGDLARSIAYKLGRDGLTAVIGPGAENAKLRKNKAHVGYVVAASGVRMSKANKDRLWQYFKGYWVEFGTKGSPRHNIPPQPPRPFMNPAYLMNRDWIKRDASKAIGKALERASRG